jgi:HEPN/Toprim N-terminal domain 1
MGSACELKFDAISVLEQKSFVPDEFICIFQESDRRELQEITEEEGDVGYFAPREFVLQRLDLLGYTAEYARSHFEKWLEQERENYGEYEKEEGGSWASETAQALRQLNYEEWLSRVRDVLLTRFDFTRPLNEYKDEIDRQMRDLQDGWLFYDANILPIIRSLLQAFPEVREVSLDIGALIGAGYIDAKEKVCETRREPDLKERPELQPTVIIAEGSTDITVLKRSLHKLYPYLSEYFTFFDFEGPKVDGGANYLVKFLRAFAAARINTNIVAIFDNDAAGVDALRVASGVPLPANIKVTKLPDIEFARAYPTIGPQGVHNIDINGRAASIELFLGRHNLSADDGNLIPVTWNGYISAVRQYQGEITEKRKVFERFLEETERNERFDYYRGRFPELALLWELIFSLVKEPQRKVILARTL